MAKTKQQKASDLDEVTSKIASAKSAVMVGYRGATVKDIDVFRRSAEKEGIFTKVYKITLIRKALEAAGVDVSGFDHKQPMILAVSDSDETVVAKHAKSNADQIKTLKIISGFIDGKLVGDAQVKMLASMPGKNEMRAKLLSVLKAPVTGVVGVMAAGPRGLVQVLQAKADKN